MMLKSLMLAVIRIRIAFDCDCIAECHAALWIGGMDAAAFVVILVVFAEAAPKCGKFEKYVQQSEPEGTCASPNPKNSPKGPPKCQCVAGCVRYKKQCIPAQQCPAATTAAPSTTASTNQASSTVLSTSTTSLPASPSTTATSTSVSPVASTDSTGATSTTVSSTAETSTSASPSTSTAQSSTGAGSTEQKSTTTAATSTTQKPAGTKCFKYLTGVCTDVSLVESAKCLIACKKQGHSFGICAKLTTLANFGAVICVCS
ncbi:hypothetical protein AAVH_11534 [Aphelenchoides avenae]|nr:hypothetical protein AAVH_11534 [Aphelenchus avenae]